MILDRIVQVKQAELPLLKRQIPLPELIARLDELPPTRNFVAALNKDQGISLIAEVKKASPSKGLICPDFDPVRLASSYQAGGASAISVLTDEQFFQGSLSYLALVKAQVELPLLRKDFVIDAYQIYEARCAGADAILLIARILSVENLREFIQLAASLDLAALVEVHDEADLAKSLAAGASIIGVNNRDLATFTTDLKVTLDLSKHIPPGCVVVSESGIGSYDDLRELQSVGVDAVLVGEALAKASDVVQSTRQMVRAGRGDLA